jgi:DNA-damage-inducible protein D
MSNIKLFESKRIRSAWNEAEEKWYFSVQDVVEGLTDTVDAKDYIKKMKKPGCSVEFQLGDNLSPD